MDRLKGGFLYLDLSEFFTLPYAYVDGEELTISGNFEELYETLKNNEDKLLVVKLCCKDDENLKNYKTFYFNKSTISNNDMNAIINFDGVLTSVRIEINLYDIVYRLKEI